jgi:hypothetical protein
MKRIGIIINLFIVSITYSENLYVDNQAGGLNNGTSWQNAWESFTDINWATIIPGDTIYISGGSSSKTYNETLQIGTSGINGSQIVIKTGQISGHNGIVVIDAQDVRNNCVYLRNYVTLDGEVNGNISILCENSVQNGIVTQRNSRGIITRYVEVKDCGNSSRMNGIEYIGSQGCVVEYCFVHGSYQDGVKFTSASGTWGSNVIRFSRVYDNHDDGVSGEDGIDIHDNIIHYQGITQATGHPDGIQTMGNYIRIWNNEIYDNETQGVILSFNRISSGHVRIYNNIFYQTAESSSIARYARGINVRSTAVANIIEDVIIANNIFVDFNFSGVEVSPNPATNISTSNPIRIYNNIFYNLYLIGGNLKYAIVCEGGAPYNPDNLLIDYNLLRDGSNGGSLIMWKGTTYTNEQFHSAGLGQSNGQISGDPSFLLYSQYGNNDYHLMSGSSAIDAGITLDTYFTMDKDGNLRSAIWDLGPYEYTGVSNTPPIPPKNLRVKP